MRDILLGLPDYQRVPWDPSRLDYMQRVLDAEERPGWLKELRYHLAYRLFGSRSLKIFFCEPEEIPEEEKEPEVYIGAFRQWLARLVAPRLAPTSERFNLFLIENVSRLRSGAVLRLRHGDTPTLFFDDQRLNEPVLVREWRLIRYEMTQIQVNEELDDREADGTEVAMSDRDQPGRPAKIQVRFRKKDLDEELIFLESGHDEEQPPS